MNINSGLFEFIKKSPTPYHAVAEIRRRLLECGFSEISEKDSAAYETDSGFVIRDSSVIAFKGNSLDTGFMICASHNDTPTFKVKGMRSGAYASLSTETYGGSIYYSWLDRPLSIAGRAAVETSDGVELRNVNIDRDLLTIPSVAIHMNRTVNEGVKLNPAKDMLPLYSLDKNSNIMELIADELDVSADEIISEDIFLYSRQEPTLFGQNEEFILSPRLDNLVSVYLSLEAFLDAEPGAISVLAVFDNEEVGSSTKQGAGSTFLHDTLLRIAGDYEKYLSMLPDSFLVSVDNAHAKHPNSPELSDSLDAPLLGEGIAIKYNANQRYTTDARSDAVFRTICKRAGAKVQSFSNRADIPGGTTLGGISATSVSISSVDIGIAQLAMHSSCETVAISDVEYMKNALEEFYSTKIITDSTNIKIV